MSLITLAKGTNTNATHYPRLRRRASSTSQDTCVVLFTSPSSGVVVHAGGDPFAVGSSAFDWDSHRFEEFVGSVQLIQE